MNMKNYFQRILLFYGISEASFKYPELPKFEAKTHQRRGSTNEWIDVLSKEQIGEINRQIPENWFERFGWNRVTR